LCLRLSQILFTVLLFTSSLLYKMPCVHRTPMLLLPLLYECSVTTVLLSGANERRHYQRIGPSLTPLPENKMDQIVNLAMFTMDRTVTQSMGHTPQLQAYNTIQYNTYNTAHSSLFSTHSFSFIHSLGGVCDPVATISRAYFNNFRSANRTSTTKLATNK